MGPIRVLIADNEEIFREGLVRLLNNQPRIQIVANCSNGTEIIEKSRESQSEFIIMSTNMPDVDTIEVVKRIEESLPRVKVCVVARPGFEPGPLTIIKAGAEACADRDWIANSIIRPLEMITDSESYTGQEFVRKLFDEVHSSIDVVVSSIELVWSGRIVIGRGFTQEFVDKIADAEDDDDAKIDVTKSKLSAREIEIARLIAEGNTNKEIAKALFIAENTVKGHVRSVLKKLELRNRQQLAVSAVLQRWASAQNENTKKQDK